MRVSNHETRYRIVTRERGRPPRSVPGQFCCCERGSRSISDKSTASDHSATVRLKVMEEKPMKTREGTWGESQ